MPTYEQDQPFGMTVAQVAKRLRVHRNQVGIWIRDNKLRASKIGRQWIITEEDLKTFVDKRANMKKERAA